ncbi:FMN-binding negative transcriptional regulator [Ureibacillus aquaedulcis]|uniref:FMN-binding negative transcriptional regulator n=1 Tax=Ureibacillus aquaedulcis TaxID=3058421 RepID=A0ABT8GVV3_9BACL|nr:FMN-binding negative transcriptional regulator [Ureibacillus sp. BA0131]MDN4495543.1 FMN-binding negative transcriptional regulator [Ureibacillus sp. BA0131]
MYIPKHFRVNDEEIIYDFIEKYSFATLFSQHNGEPYATHLPLTLNRSENVLYGHFGRQNEQWKDIEKQQILVVFQGPHCYISPTWYETSKGVPTWNYVSIHLYGEMEIVDNPNVIFDSLNDMVKKYEKADSSYNLKNVDSKFIEGMIKGIAAFKIDITKIEAKAKLSQNHTIERQGLVIKHLENTSNQDNLQIASLMKKNLQKYK